MHRAAEGAGYAARAARDEIASPLTHGGFARHRTGLRIDVPAPDGRRRRASPCHLPFVWGVLWLARTSREFRVRPRDVPYERVFGHARWTLRVRRAPRAPNPEGRRHTLTDTGRSRLVKNILKTRSDEINGSCAVSYRRASPASVRWGVQRSLPSARGGLKLRDPRQP